MLSYFKCDQIATDPNNPADYYNDANWCDPEYDKLYQQQNVELDRDRRIEIVHEMLTRFQQSAVYNVFALTPDLQAYRTDRFEGFVRQPAEIGPVLFSNTSPSYAQLKLVGSSGDGGGGIGTAGYVALAVAAGAAILLAVILLGRRRSVDERE
jgi:peptide/nickel transport system substrate-binding protein